jgi:hypothetical protein
VRSLVHRPIPVELSHVQALAQNLVDQAFVNSAPQQGHAFSPDLCDEGIQGVLACRETLEQLCDNGRRVRIGTDNAFAIRTVNVDIPYRGATGINPRARLFQHPFSCLFSQVQDVVAGHQYAKPVHQLIRRAGVRADNTTFFNQMNRSPEIVQRPRETSGQSGHRRPSSAEGRIGEGPPGPLLLAPGQEASAGTW